MRDRPRLVAGVVALALTYVAVQALRKGVINMGGGRTRDFWVSADGEPGLYWGTLLFTSACAAGLYWYLWHTRGGRD